MLKLMKRVWRAWKRLAHRLISAQNFVLMALVYWLALAPVAIALKLVRKRVVDEAPPTPEGTFWQERKSGPMDMERAGRMF